MLRISTVDTESERRLVVEGKLIDLWVEELKTAWRSASENLQGRKLIIDLSNATSISREGESALLEMMNEGAKFSCCGVLTRHVLKQLTEKCRDRFRKVRKKDSNPTISTEVHVATSEKRS